MSPGPFTIGSCTSQGPCMSPESCVYHITYEQTMMHTILDAHVYTKNRCIMHIPHPKNARTHTHTHTDVRLHT